MIDDAKGPRSRMRRDPGLEAHRTAVANTLSWAEESAGRGDYANALAWLQTTAAIASTTSSRLPSRTVKLPRLSRLGIRGQPTQAGVPSSCAIRRATP